MEAKKVDVDGITMRWIEHGAGMPVILVHGIPTSPELWRKVMGRVPNARLLAWEMVGYGNSIEEGRRHELSIAKQADYLSAFMRAIKVERAVLVGHDLGGGVVQILAVNEPARCSGIVLTNAIGYDSWPIPSVRAMQMFGRIVEHMPDFLLRANLAMLLYRGHDDLRVATESLNVHFERYAAADGAHALIRQVRALDTQDTLAIQDRLRELRGLPAKVVWGAADPFQKLRYGRRLASDLDCELIEIPGGKHFVPEDHPEILAEAIRSVVEQATAGARAPNVHA